MIGEIITTSPGRIRGFEKDGCRVYLGIPFAKPPVGEVAFRNPLPPEPWEDVLDATHGSGNPIQAKGGFAITNNSQDCLYLNVFVPKGVSEPLPVIGVDLRRCVQSGRCRCAGKEHPQAAI